MDYYAIGKRIRKIRKARGLSQEQLAELVGISTTHMSHIETGNTKMSLSTFADIASALEALSDELLYDISSRGRNISLSHISELLEDCSTTEIRVIEDIVKATKESLKKNI